MSMSGCLMGHVNVNVWVFEGLCQCSFAWHVLRLPCSLSPTLISVTEIWAVVLIVVFCC
jgi:hypothetical protein